MKYIKTENLDSPEFSTFINDDTKDIINEFKKYGGIDLEILKILPTLHCKELNLAERLLPLIVGNAGVEWYQLVKELPYITNTTNMEVNFEYIKKLTINFEKGTDIESVKQILKEESKKNTNENIDNVVVNQENEKLKNKLSALQSKYDALQSKYDRDTEIYKKIINERNKRIKEVNALLSEKELFNKDRSEQFNKAVTDSLVKSVVDCTKEVLEIKRMLTEVYSDFENSTFEKFINAKFTKLEEKVEEFRNKDFSFNCNTIDEESNPDTKNDYYEEVNQEIKNKFDEMNGESSDADIKENVRINDENNVVNPVVNTFDTPEEVKRGYIINFFEELKKKHMLKIFKKLDNNEQKKTINEYCFTNKLSIKMIKSVNQALKRNISPEFVYGLLVNTDMSVEEFNTIVKEA